MEHTDWYKKAVIYQIYPRSFADGNNDGLGDLRGIISKLDYLKDLGVNCVWLSPIYDSPQEDNGYDIANYKAIYPPFGTMADFDEMIQGMHERGIRLIMDLVVNHTSSEHVWFKEALKDKNSPYRDYYYFRKGKKNGKKPPNNWTGFFGGSTWEKVQGSEDYYLHLFAKGQPDLNWENPKVREEVKDILRFWLDKGVDGFRCDVITLISKKQDFKDRFPTLALTGMDAYVNGPRLHEFLHELYRDVYSNYDCMTVGETVLSTLEQAKELVDPKREELSMVFNFDHTDVDNYFGVKWIERKFKLKNLKKAIKKWQHGLYGCGWNSLFIENHDQRRCVGRFNTDDKEYRIESAKMLGTTYFLLQGTPFIYQGQEIGMTNGDFKTIDDFMDVETHNMDKMRKDVKILAPILNKSLFSRSRDNARTPMQWDESEYAGFSTVKPWLKVNANHTSINVKESLQDENSIYHYYQALIKLRKENEIIEKGTYEEIENISKKLYGYKRQYQGNEVIVISNFFKEDVKCDYLDSLKDYALVLTNVKEAKPNLLGPYETRVYITKEKQTL